MVRAAPAPDALLPIVSVIKFYATRQSSSVTLHPGQGGLSSIGLRDAASERNSSPAMS